MRILIAIMFGAAASTAAADVPTAKPGDDKLICKTVKEMGSRLGGKRVCRTKEQWAEDKRHSRDVVDRAQKGGSTCYSMC